MLITLLIVLAVAVNASSFVAAGVKGDHSDFHYGVTQSYAHLTLTARPDSPPYPLIETFDSPDGFTQTSDKVYIEGGKVHWDVQGDGPQFIYRSIPPFSGDFRLTVRGTIDGGEYNCGVGAGVGDDLAHGAGVGFQLMGGGCDVHGPMIGAYGVDLHHRYLGCQPQGTFLWVQSGKAYTATLTFAHPEGTLAVNGVGEQTATPQYEGIIDTLMVGQQGNPGMLRCIGSIDTIIIEPINALIAPTNLTATVSYPTQIDLTWQENATGESEIRVERWDAEIGWHLMVPLPANAGVWRDDTVMCDTDYRYRVAAYKEDGTFSGYSPEVEIGTAPCAERLGEDWESGIDMKVWKPYGFPRPELRTGEGVEGSTALDPNGDGIFASGVITQKRFDTTSGIEAEAWIRSHSEVGQIYSGLEFALSTCQASDRYEECGAYTNVAHVISYPEENRIVYQVLLHQAFNEVFAPFDNTWEHYRIRIRPDGLVAFYRNDALIFVDPVPIDVSAYPALTVDVRGRSINSEHYIDDIKVRTPAKPDWYVRVVDEHGLPVSGATVYANGEILGESNQAGMVNVTPLEDGTLLTAVKPISEQRSFRAGHDGWAYRTYLTSLLWRGDEPHPYRVHGPGEQHLVLTRDHPLVLFNLLVSIEWDATEAYLDAITRAMQRASDYLLDVSDGQMAFGHVSIYENAEHWTEADLQISAKNIVHPHAYIGGITDPDTSHVIRLGRAWDGQSGARGAWDAPDGYRTIIHEFGHYGLRLWDEYFGFIYDQGGDLLDSAPATCTGLENRNPANDDLNGSIMDYQYTSSEFSARNVNGLWSPLCEETAQFQITGRSAWEAIEKTFEDSQIPKRWTISTPEEAGGVRPGPHNLPSSLPTWPEIEVHPLPGNCQPRQLFVLDPGEQPYQGAIVALYKNDGRVIGQGFSDEQGQIEVFGAETGDKVRAASIDGGIAGQTILGLPEESATLMLSPIGAMNVAQLVGERPYMQIIAEPGSDSEHIDLLTFLYNYSPLDEPLLSITLPGEQGSYAPDISYSPETGAYKARVGMTTKDLGTGGIRVQGIVHNSVIRQQSTFRLQRSNNLERNDIYSDDGNLDLYLDANSLPGAETYLTVMPPGALPGPIPSGYAVVGYAYNITASGAVAVLEKPGLLKLRYDNAILPPGLAVDHLGIRRWDPITSTWKVVPASLDREQETLSAVVTELGTYVLMIPEQNQLYLPSIIR